MTLKKNYCWHQKTLRELVERYKQKRISFDKQHETLDKENGNNNFIETSIFKHLAFNIFIFVMAIISVIIIHLFKITGSINKGNITLHKNTIWDVMEIDWRPVTITLSGNVINLPSSVIIHLEINSKLDR